LISSGTLHVCLFLRLLAGARSVARAINALIVRTRERKGVRRAHPEKLGKAGRIPCESLFRDLVPVPLLLRHVDATEIENEVETQTGRSSCKRAMPCVAVPDNQRARRRVDGQKPVGIVHFIWKRMAAELVTARPEAKRSILLRIVAENEGCVGDLR